MSRFISTSVIEVSRTSLDPYGQLFKLLMPRASAIAIYDREVMPLWTSDGVENGELVDLMREAALLCEGGSDEPGMMRELNGETAYAFVLRDGRGRLIGIAGLTLPDTNSGSRPFDFIQGLLRPALEVLARELANQFSIEHLHRSLSSRDDDLEWLMTAADNTGDLERMLRGCIRHLRCAFGAALIPEKHISAVATSDELPPGAGADVLNRVHRHLLAWSQVQRRTIALNKFANSGPLSGLNYKILVTPILQGDQRVTGILAMFRHADADNFGPKQIGIVELLARRIGHVLHGAYDASTGLLTRAALEKRALEALQAKEAESYSAMYVDIDRLHALNDSYGMHVGDEAIVRVADAIRTVIGPQASAARVAGDGFGAFLPGCSLEEAGELAEKLRRSVEKLESSAARKTIDLSLSIGVAAVALRERQPTHVLADAETACKVAKERGRDRVEIYQDVAQNDIRREQEAAILASVRDALANDRFRLEAQPVVTFGNAGSQRHFELLLRMIGDDLQSVPPGRFLGVAARNQLTTAIDRWVLQYVLELLSSAADKLVALGAHFSVNISPQSLADEQFPGYLCELLTQYALPPSLLAFEVPESAAVANIVRTETLLRRLHDLGHEIVLDDFGRGLSSLTYLSSLPACSLKIDGALVRDAVANPRAQAAIAAIVELAATSNLQTIAESVESEAIMRLAAHLGVKGGQGFYIGRPRPLETVLKELLDTAAIAGVGEAQAFNQVRLAG